VDGCPSCGARNTPDAAWCSRCLQVVRPEEMLRLQQRLALRRDLPQPAPLDGFSLGPSRSSARRRSSVRRWSRSPPGVDAACFVAAVVLIGLVVWALLSAVTSVLCPWLVPC
jgi:ribosomal protein L40E